MSTENNAAELPESERQTFEEWVKRTRGSPWPIALDRADAGNYMYLPATEAWEVWRARAILSAKSQQEPSEPAASHFIWTHTKSGGKYRVVGTAKIQSDKPLQDMDDVVVYIGYDRQLWARAQTEFVDRFTRGHSEPQPVRLRQAQVTKLNVELSKRFGVNLSSGVAASLLREVMEAR